ncbi:Uncharacterised protein [Serratia plymuthica]|uniref:Uncharacterized protein n=1 Tax=Serratia plymuthica TaxID=82996 RepID=A0A2X4WXZ9_SERPL|nr:Uncharacterised protein [Serratia plymuthica]
MPSPTPYTFQLPIHSPRTATNANMLTVRAISLIGHILARSLTTGLRLKHTINRDSGISGTGGMWVTPQNATGEAR